MISNIITRTCCTLTLLFCIISFGNAQTTEPQVDHCATVEVEANLQKRYPQHSKDAFERWLEPLVRKYKSSAQKRAVVTLPIIFHIVHYGDPLGTGDNVPDDFVSFQIEQLNNDFRRRAGTTGFNDNPVGADVEIEFCAARVDPSGNVLATPGINRVDAQQRGWINPPFSTTYTNDVIKPATQFDPDLYVNVWVADLASSTPGFTLLGYAQFPDMSGLPGLPTLGGLASTDGVAIAPFTVGSTTNPNPNGGARFGRGRTLTHELGHYFGLRHIWGDGGCQADDFCNDTPAANVESTGCSAGKMTCGSLDMIENYMDYSDDECMNIFTQDQKARMLTVLSNSPRRNTLSGSTACASGSLLAAFTASSTAVFEGETVDFTDTSTGNPTSWSWTFEGGSPGTSNSQNPTITYNTPGVYQVSLTVSNGASSDTRTIDNYITVNPGFNCSAVVNSFPYQESFESNLGLWSQDNGEDLDWSRNSGGTLSSGTGPSSAVDGNFYIYTEASSGNSNRTAILNSPCFDFSSLSNGSFDFQYHLYGSNQGTLSLEVSNNGGVNWNQIWTQSGDQGDNWFQVSVNLSAYAGNSAVIFRFVGQTGNGFRSDMAIDDINIGAGGGSGGGNPPVADFSANNTSIQVGQSVNFSDLSTNSPTSWSWTFNGGSPGSSTAQNPIVTYNTAGTYDVTLTATNADGSDTETKTGFITVSSTPPTNGCVADITTYPYSESFEINLGAWSQDTNDDFNWTRDSNGTPSNGTGPSSATDGNFYMYTEASGGNTNNTGILNSPCFELPAGTDASFDFSYHMFGSNMGSLALEISQDGGNNWTNLWSIAGDQGNQWFQQQINLSAFAGGTLQLRFVGVTGNGFRSDIAIDAISLSTSTPSNNPPVADFSASQLNIFTGQSVNFTDLSSNNPTSWSWTFAGGTPNTSSAQNPTVTYNQAGVYAVSLTATNNNGSDTETKNAYITVTETSTSGCTADVNTFPYSESFEANLGLWTQATGDDFNWTRDSNGTPSSGTGPSSARDGNFYMYTEASGGNTNNTGILNSPCFDLNGLSSANFTFAYHMNGTNMGTLRLEISDDDDNSWNTLWTISGNQGNQWFEQNISLNSYVGRSVRLRFVGITGNGFRSDIAIDDITLDASNSSGGAPVAAFTADQTVVQEGTTINFTDLSTGNPTSWSWTFVGGTPSTSSQQNPSITYNTAGTYEVSLTVSNTNGNNTTTQSAYITVNAVSNSGCANGITAFPYTESFESDLGQWTQLTNDDFDWTRDSNGTPSSTTGPSSGADGNFYLYTEASGGNTNNRAIIESPCIDISGLAAPELSYSYHMYGSNMGTLTLEISDDDGANWTTLWTLSGNQGNQWLSNTISLSAYNGGVLFRFVGRTGFGFRSDMAIDNFRIQAAATREVNTFATITTNTLSLAIAPNPTYDILNLTYESGEEGDGVIMVSDVYGRLVLNQSVYINEGSSQLPVDLSSLSAGSYIITLQGKTQSVSKRFIKLQ